MLYLTFSRLRNRSFRHRWRMRNVLLYLLISLIFFSEHFGYSECMLSFYLSMSCSWHYAIIVIVPCLTYICLNLLTTSTYINQLVALAFALKCIIYECRRQKKGNYYPAKSQSVAKDIKKYFPLTQALGANEAIKFNRCRLIKLYFNVLDSLSASVSLRNIMLISMHEA